MGSDKSKVIGMTRSTNALTRKRTQKLKRWRKSLKEVKKNAKDLADTLSAQYYENFENTSERLLQMLNDKLGPEEEEEDGSEEKDGSEESDSEEEEQENEVMEQENGANPEVEEQAELMCNALLN